MRVPRTFVFVDLGGFTKHTVDFGDDSAGAILSSFRAIVRDVASERGVRIAKWLGDGCMIVAVDHQDAIAACMDLSERSHEGCKPLSLRIGIATGYALLFEGDDYIGSAVNLAARLCDAADGWEILLPAISQHELPPGVTATPHTRLELRGFPEPIDVVALSGAAPPTESDDTGELWTRSPFVA